MLLANAANAGMVFVFYYQDFPRCWIEPDGYVLCHHAQKHVSKYQIKHQI
jgi:hypothetical protein